MARKTPRSGGRPAKDALFEALAAVAKALANGRRAEIVELLAQGPRSVDDVADAIDQSVANTSHHLRTLARAGLVTTRRDGTRIIYRLVGPDVYDLWRTIREVAERQLEIDDIARAYLGDSTGFETVTRDELAERLARGEVVLVDVRPELEHRAGHIPGALSIPVEELERRLGELPGDLPIVAYCRGPYCVYADDAVRTLVEAGRQASRLEEGFPEWELAGHPVERDLASWSAARRSSR